MFYKNKFGKIKLTWKALPICKFCEKTAALDQRFKYSAILQELPNFFWDWDWCRIQLHFVQHQSQSAQQIQCQGINHSVFRVKWLFVQSHHHDVPHSKNSWKLVKNDKFHCGIFSLTPISLANLDFPGNKYILQKEALVETWNVLGIFSNFQPFCTTPVNKLQEVRA